MRNQAKHVRKIFELPRTRGKRHDLCSAGFLQPFLSLLANRAHCSISFLLFAPTGERAERGGHQGQGDRQNHRRGRPDRHRHRDTQLPLQAHDSQVSAVGGCAYYVMFHFGIQSRNIDNQQST